VALGYSLSFSFSKLQLKWGDISFLPELARLLEKCRRALRTQVIPSSTRRTDERIRLIDLLNVLGPVNATEPRDYLNAFLGLSIEAEKGELQPGYDQPVEETFGSFAWYRVKNGQGIKIMFTACKC
jgi:hypothetical protein